MCVVLIHYSAWRKNVCDRPRPILVYSTNVVLLLFSGFHKLPCSDLETYIDSYMYSSSL